MAFSRNAHDAQTAAALRGREFVRSFEPYIYVGLFEDETRLEEESRADLWVGQVREKVGPYALREYRLHGTWCVCEGGVVIDEFKPEEFRLARQRLYGLANETPPPYADGPEEAVRPLWGPPPRGWRVRCAHAI